FDVYVWVRTNDLAAVLSRFIDRYVDGEDPGDPRFDAFVRTCVSQDPAPGDDEALADLRRDDSAVNGFSLYLRAKAHEAAIVTITEEGDLVLGLSLDDPENAAETYQKASALMASLRAEFAAQGGVAGVELPPPQSVSEWANEGLILLREGNV
ncbi:MAG TPA: hypothetical protein VGD71_18095, partial [Kribbella sp.]